MDSKQVLAYFSEIMTVPRESGHEALIIRYLQEFAKNNQLECKTDEAGNVLICKEATPGCEAAPVVVLQSHSDMVCEKNNGVEHDFAKDPIRAVAEDGWLIAKDTTLGADCGIGMAAQMAALTDPDLQHGPLEALFTVSEETGLDGAFALQPDFLTGKMLINLDSEDEGELFIGCAGGIDTTAVFTYQPQQPDAALSYFKIGFKGGMGGHSGDDIDKNRSNAVQLLARVLFDLNDRFDLTLCTLQGGNKRNALARESEAIIGLPADGANAAQTLACLRGDEIAAEFATSDPDVRFYWEPAAAPAVAIDQDTAQRLILALNAVAHGVLDMSADIKGLVETSTNLASVKMMPDNQIRIGTSQRSSTNSARYYASRRVESAFRLAGAKVTHESEYPGWKPRLTSPLLEICKTSYKELFGKDPIVRAIHAGLECGLFLDKYPDMDMISFGPTIRGVHAPGERLDLASLDKFVEHLTDVIQRLARV